MSIAHKSADSTISFKLSQIEEKAKNLALPERPGLGPIDQINYGSHIPNIRDAFIVEKECSIIPDICNVLKQEIFREGIEIVPKFASKCKVCGHEKETADDVCDNCGSQQIREPNYAEQGYFEHLDGVSFIQCANHSHQTLQEVCEEAEYHLDVCDNAYILAVKTYMFDEKTRDVSFSFVDEIITLDPRYVDKVFDKSGKPGGMHRLCLKHRQKLLGKDDKICPVCGSKTHDVTYKVRSTLEGEFYYVDDEICHLIKYHPNKLYGLPPVFDLYDNLKAYSSIERRLRMYFERGRPSGVLFVKSPNIQQVAEAFSKIDKDARTDPMKTPLLVLDGMLPQVDVDAKFINFLSDPSEQWVKVKDEIRRAICSYYNVSPVYEADVDGSGGLNNESLQVKVTNRSVAKGQAVWNTKFFPWLFKQFNIVDFILRLIEAEIHDEVSELNLQLLDDQHAQNMKALGFDVELDQDGEFVFTKSENPLADSILHNPILQQAAQPQPNPDEAVSGEVEKSYELAPEELVPEELPELKKKDYSLDEEPQYTGDEDTDAQIYADSLINKSDLESKAKQILNAFKKTHFPDFKSLSKDEQDAVLGIILKNMLKGKWSVDSIITDIQKSFKIYNDWLIRMIVRTETARIALKGRELVMLANDPPESTYRWIGPSDRHTSDCCSRIKREQPAEGLPLLELKEFCQRIAKEEGLNPQEWIMHPNERHRFVRYFGDLT